MSKCELSSKRSKVVCKPVISVLFVQLRPCCEWVQKEIEENNYLEFAQLWIVFGGKNHFAANFIFEMTIRYEC